VKVKYLENSLQTRAGDEAAVDALVYGATHADGSKVIEIDMADVSARSRIMEGRD
jgi:hypothetical protein